MENKIIEFKEELLVEDLQKANYYNFKKQRKYLFNQLIFVAMSIIMIVMSALVIFLNLGTGKMADTCGLNSSFADVAVGIVIFVVVGCEFFINYSIKFKNAKNAKKEWEV